MAKKVEAAAAKPMSLGLKDSLEVLEAMGTISAIFAEELDDGFQVADIMRIGLKLGSKQTAREIMAAISGASQVVAEGKDLTPEEFMKLGMAAFEQYKKVSEALNNGK